MRHAAVLPPVLNKETPKRSGPRKDPLESPPDDFRQFIQISRTKSLQRPYAPIRGALLGKVS
jgi:hypothetical protein